MCKCVFFRVSRNTLLGVLLLTLFSGTFLPAQESRATITGTVLDPQGAAIPRAEVIAKNLGTNVETRASTNETGLYVVPFVNPGTYTVMVTAAGFKSAVQERLELSLGQRQQLDFKLEVGAISEQITVTAEPELLNTTNAILGTRIDARKVADLPLLGKNPYTFAYHAAGALHINPAGSITDRPYDNGGMDYVVIAGGRAFTNEYLLDGAPNTNTERGRSGSLSFVPPPEATEEIAVLTNNYDAQYGRTGGGVISATLKSGTNAIHGSVYHYFRNKLLNANTFQANRQGQQRAQFIWNQPGVTVNGPVYIPKLYDGRNKTFFLFSWEGIYQNIPNNPLETVPTEKNRVGDFSDLHQSNGNPITIYDPLTTTTAGVRQPFAGNQIDAARFNPISLKLMEFIPQPNFAPNSQGFQNHVPQTGLVTKERYNAYTIKVDQVLTDRHRLMGNYVRNRRWQTGPDYGWPVPSRGPNNFQRFNQGATMQLTSTLGPTTVVTTRFGFTQHDFGNFANGGGYDPRLLGFPDSLVSQAQAETFPSIGITSYTGFGGAANTNDTSTNWYFTVSANKVISKHSVKFGGEIRVPLDNLPNYRFASFSFSDVFTRANPNSATASTGNAFASFLLGFPASGNAPVDATPAWGNRFYGLYIQDDWRITNTLTVNLGGRWDYDTPQTERYNRQNAGFDPSATYSLGPGVDARGGLLFTSASNRYPHKRDLNNFQPRVGLSWRMLPKTVMRAGYGLSYVPLFVNGQTQGFSTQTPYVASNDNNYTPANNLSNPFPDGILAPTGSALGPATFAGQTITYINTERVIPYIQQYSFGFQHELPWQVVVDMSYVGSQTRKLGVNKNINDLTVEQLAQGTAYLNQSIPNPYAGLLPGTNLNSATTPRRNLVTDYPQFANINRNELSVGKAWYNSLQLTVTKRLSQGFNLQFTYTYSASMEAVNYLNNQFSDDQLQRVRTQEDLPQRASIMGGYEIPLFRTSGGLKQKLLGGWQIQAIGIFQSGRQLNGVDAYPTGVSPYLDGEKVPDGYYFNACTINTAGNRQNCASADQQAAWVQRPSDTLRVTGTRWSQLREMRPFLMDSSVFKSFYPREGLQIQFRFEAFNTFNTPWFGQAQTGITNSRFGLQGNSQTNDQRNTQVALKITF